MAKDTHERSRLCNAIRPSGARHEAVADVRVEVLRLAAKQRSRRVCPGKEAIGVIRRAGVLAAAPGVLAGLSVRGQADVVVIVVVVVAALCWIIADPDRSERLAMLISAWRGGGRPPAAS